MSLLLVAASVKRARRQQCEIWSKSLLQYMHDGNKEQFMEKPKHTKCSTSRFRIVACTLGKSTLKRAFLYHYTNLGKIFDFKLLNSIFSCLDVNSWHLLAGTCQLQLVCFLTQLLCLFWGLLSFSHTHHVPMQELANCLPCMGVLTTHRHEGLPFCIKDSLFVFIYSRRCCDLRVTQQYIQYNFSFGIKKRPTFVAANGHWSVSCCWRAGGWCPNEKASLCINPKTCNIQVLWL